MKKLLFLMSLIFSVNSVAAGFVCAEDRRPVDGPYRELQLTDKGNGTYDITYFSVPGYSDQGTSAKLAQGVTCNVSTADSRVVTCRGADGFLMMSKKTAVTQMDASAEEGKTVTSRFVDVSFPRSKGEGSEKEYRFMYADCKAK